MMFRKLPTPQRPKKHFVANIKEPSQLGGAVCSVVSLSATTRLGARWMIKREFPSAEILAIRPVRSSHSRYKYFMGAA